MEKQYSVMLIDSKDDFYNNLIGLKKLNIYKLILADSKDHNFENNLKNYRPNLILIKLDQEEKLDIIRFLKKSISTKSIPIIAVGKNTKLIDEAIEIGISEAVESEVYERVLERVIKRVLQQKEILDELKVSREQIGTLIEELSYVKKVLSQSIKKDPLTNLYNRREMEELLKYQISQFERNKRPFSIGVCDIDYLKHLNGNYGYQIGDLVIRETAFIIQKMIRKLDFVGRWSGGSFLLILPETDTTGAEVISQRIRKKIEEHMFEVYEKTISMTISIGLTSYTKKEDIEITVSRACEAVYKGKDLGGNSVYII